MCVCVFIGIYVYNHTYIHMYMYAQTHTCAHTHEYMHACKRTCIARTYINTRIHNARQREPQTKKNLLPFAQLKIDDYGVRGMEALEKTLPFDESEVRLPQQSLA